MEDPDATESISKADGLTEAASEKPSTDSSFKANEMAVGDEKKSTSGYKVEAPKYQWNKQSASEGGGDLYHDAQKGNTRAGAAKPDSKETIKVVNGQYWHRHPGYLSGAKTLEEAEWHPASQRHRGKNGQDITEKLHIAGGLGKNGLLGAPQMSVGDAFMADLTSGGRTVGLLGTLADLGFSTAERQAGALFGLADAMLKGNPLSVSSGIIGQATNAFKGFADDLDEAREKYMIPEDVSQSALMNTIMGRAFSGQKAALEEAYRSEGTAADDILDIAVDKSIAMPGGGSFFDEYSTGIEYKEGDDYRTYLNSLSAAKKVWLDANGHKVNGDRYDDVRRDAVQQMNEDTLQMYSKGLYERNKEFARAMDDLIQRGEVHTIGSDGRIDFSSSTKAKDMDGAQVDMYKRRLQIGSSMTSEQLQTIADRTKGLQRRVRAELANKRRHDAEMRRQEKEIHANRMKQIRTRGNMGEVAVAEVGGNVLVDHQHDPITKEQLIAASKRLMQLMDGNKARRDNALADGVTDPKMQREKYLVFSTTEMKEADKTMERWQDKIKHFDERSKDYKKAAEDRWLLNKAPSDRIRAKHFSSLDAKGLPLSYDGCVRMTSMIRNDRAGWESNADNMDEANDRLNTYIDEIASRAGRSSDEVRDALSSNPDNNRLYEMLKDMSKAETSALDDKDAYNSYVDLLNTQNVSDAKAVLYGINLSYNSKGKDKERLMSTDDYNACYNTLNSMIYQMADGCKASSEKGVMYDKGRVDTINDNLDKFRRAIATGTKISPSEFLTPTGGFDAVSDMASVHYGILDEAVAAASKDEFYTPVEDGEFLLKDILGGSESALQRKTRQDMLAMMGLRGGLRRTVDENNQVNQFFAALGSRTGNGRRGVDPFSYSARDGEDKDGLMRVLRSEMSAYDIYKGKHPGDTAMSHAMERHMDYLTEKMAIADMRIAGGMDAAESRVLDDYEADLDKEIRKELVNSTADGPSHVLMDHIKGGYLGDAVNPDDYADVQNSKASSLRMSLTGYSGYNRDIREVANMIGNDFTIKFSDEAYYMVSKDAMDDFLGYGGTVPPKADILTDTGFDMDSPMDHMLVATLKSAGVESMRSLEGMSKSELDTLYRTLDRTKDRYINDRGLANSEQRAVLARSCIVAQDMVRMYASRQNAWKMLNENPPAWYTKLGEEYDQGTLESIFDQSFRRVFRNVKSTRWTFSDLDDLRRKGTRDAISGQEFTETDADYMTSIALFCASSGMDPSGGQGVPDPDRAQDVIDRQIDELMSAGTQARNIRKLFGDMDERFTSNNTTRTVTDASDPTREIIHSENNVVMTLSGEFNAYAMGENEKIADAVYPINLYRMFRALMQHRGAKVKDSKVDDILRRFSQAHAGIDMNMENIKAMYSDNVVDAIALVNSTRSMSQVPGGKPGEMEILHAQDMTFILPIVEDPVTHKREVFLTEEYQNRYNTDNIADLNSKATGPLAETMRTSGMESVLPAPGKRFKTATRARAEPLRDQKVTKSSSDGSGAWSEESIAKAACQSPLAYLRDGRRTMEEKYGLDLVGGRIIENMPYVAGMKGTDVYVMANRTADAVLFTKDGGVKYISRRFGDIECRKFRQTLAGVDVMVTMPWALVDRTPPCLFYGLLDVYVPWAADGFQDPRVVAQTAKTRASFEEAAEAAALIRDFGGFDDSPEIEADPVSRKIRNIIMRAYAKVGAFGKWVFDQARSKAQTMPRITMDNYYTVLSAAYQLAKDITLGPCTSHGAWHLIKGIRSNALLALSANPFMQYRRKYASPRPEVDAIAYIGRDAESGERELHVRDMMMLVGLMSACEQIRLWPLIPRFYEDPSPEWKDAADYWYIMLHHPSPLGTYGEQVEEVGRPSEPAEEGQDAGP